MQTKIMVLLGMGLFFLVNHAGAEFYQYRDEAGRIVFTDDLSRLPEKDREAVLRFESRGTGEAEPAGHDLDAAEAIAEPVSMEEKAAFLESERKALAEAFRSLGERQKVLEERVEALTKADREAVAAHNAEVAAFEEDRKAYEQRRREYNRGVEAFNARVHQAGADEENEAP
ncbi:uncharacterized protein DUF4124 [Desulfobotulus alkaliphilus]|uniref:Uncharacterized protein DUF4124 n=1 Tax=Desulfobotulus alkaliphilus TaxID=622671 RepID=A0A562R3G1_9BACT|nr:DUF4124 domain-containing protein [Desulfobotulus alkaliphilus]TWI63363.1 uncharacterized protein DUF4124 [Desulfobotulus alkaliphilus]